MSNLNNPIVIGFGIPILVCGIIAIFCGFRSLAYRGDFSFWFWIALWFALLSTFAVRL